MIAVALESFELSHPVDDAAGHRSPVKLVAFPDDVFAVAVSDAIFGKEIVSVGVRSFAAGGGVARIPIQHERPRLHGGQNLRGFGTGSRVTGWLVFQNKDDSLLLGFGRSLAQLVIDCGAVGRLIVEAPEIEAADALGSERLGHLDGALEDFVLLAKGEAGVEALRL